jgi:hypothetical protein
MKYEDIGIYTRLGDLHGDITPEKILAFGDRLMDGLGYCSKASDDGIATWQGNERLLRHLTITTYTERPLCAISIPHILDRWATLTGCHWEACRVYVEFLLRPPPGRVLPHHRE